MNRSGTYWRGAALLVLLCGAGPATAPAPAPDTTPRPMARAYELLTVESIFVKGRMTQQDVDTPASTAVTRAERTVVFNGVTQADGAFVAFVEDMSNNKISKVRVGDTVGVGKVRRITLDEMEYEAGGKVRTVAVGQNLGGVDAWNLTYGVATATTQPTTGPAGAPGPTSDVLLRMQQRRQQELNGK